MDEFSIEKEMDLLMSNFWITKDRDKENYYLLRRNQDKIKNFLSRTTGNKLIVHDRFIKLEKIPGMANKSGGISTFVSKYDYIILFLLLLYLEDKTRGEKFILSSLIDYIRNTAITLELENVPNWLDTNTRKSLVRVIEYLLNKNIITLRDSDNRSFVDTVEADALYESTGLANYLIPSFDYSIFDLESANDFLKQEWSYQDEEKGNVRRYKVYRNLLYYPLFMKSDISLSEEDYLKKMHKVIEKELSQKLNMETQITKNMFMLFANEDVNEKEYFPNAKNISDLVLIINRYIMEYKDRFSISLNDDETFMLSYYQFDEILKSVMENEKRYFSKGIYDKGITKFRDEVINYMSDFHFIRTLDDGILVTPGVSRFIGMTDNKKTDNNEQLELEVSNEL